MEKEHFEILLEEMRGKFDLVLEGHAALDRKIDDRFDLLDGKVEHCNFKIEVLNQKIDTVEERLSERIDEVEANLSARVDQVEASLNARIDHVEATLTQHIEAVETNLGARIDAVAADLSAHRADTEGHKGVFVVRES